MPVCESRLVNAFIAIIEAILIYQVYFKTIHFVEESLKRPRLDALIQIISRVYERVQLKFGGNNYEIPTQC
jgi:hypothetical protein